MRTLLVINPNTGAAVSALLQRLALALALDLPAPLLGVQTVDRSGGEMAADPTMARRLLALACSAALERWPAAQSVLSGGASLVGLGEGLAPDLHVPWLCKVQLAFDKAFAAALDATVQIQVLMLRRERQRDLGLAIVFVTHDIGAALEVADRVAVMYAGRMVEEGTARELMRSQRHPYTLALLRGRAHGARAKRERLLTIAGAPPDLSRLPPGCAFAERCSLVQDHCRSTQPCTVEIVPGHRVRCLRTDATEGA